MELKGLIDRAEKIVPVSSDDTFRDWRETCSICEKRLEDDVLRMAVVGTIKSGKSTFINSLFSGDYLKRGAGVVTSIVTKVRRSSDRLRAFLIFKSWDEINSEINNALHLFPSTGWQSAHSSFDIRKLADRSDLKSALESLESKHLLSKDTRNMSIVLLGAYLEGYSTVENIISDQVETVVYDDDRFPEQKAFAGSEALAVYLRDIRLEIPAGDIEENIEIADCQGSDSPNPLHLVMIQDYLRTADLLVYLVSSRTGLRQADIRFLKMIRNMVGINNLLFVLNSDFNEHESLDDLQRVAGKTREEISLIVRDPAIYIFSALYALFSARENQLPEKERKRLAQWKAEEDLVKFSEGEKVRFERAFRRLITENRYNLLIRNQLQRMKILTSDFRRWIELNREILTADAGGADNLMKKIRQQQKKTERIKAMAKSTLDGAVEQIRKEIRSDVDRFFDIRYGAIGPGILDFIQNYAVSFEIYRKQLAEIGFSDTLSAVFHTFKEDLDRYVAEQVNPVLFQFIREKEIAIVDHFESIAGPYDAMISETLAEYRITGKNGDNGTPGYGDTGHIELDSLKKSRGLAVPPASATLAYSTALKTEAFMRLGFYRFVNTVRKAFKRGENRETVDMPALKSGVARMKKETEASLNFHFKNFKENIKFQYLFKLIESMSDEMYNLLVSRFNSYQSDLSSIRAITGQDQDAKTDSLREITGLSDALFRMRNRIEELERQIQS